MQSAALILTETFQWPQLLVQHFSFFFSYLLTNKTSLLNSLGMHVGVFRFTSGSSLFWVEPFSALAHGGAIYYSHHLKSTLGHNSSLVQPILNLSLQKFVNSFRKKRIWHSCALSTSLSCYFPLHFTILFSGFHFKIIYLFELFSAGRLCVTGIEVPGYCVMWVIFMVLLLIKLLHVDLDFTCFLLLHIW